MDGVNILAVAEVMGAAPGWSWLGFIFAIGTAMFLTMGIIGLKHCDVQLACLSLVFFVLTGIFTVSLFLTSGTYVSGYKYKVTIDESVSLVEFNEKYEILDQDGKIFTIREKIPETEQ